ncbi:MAG TPA: cation diffusion facilitator family transporter [Aestuariivirgaceae bacterium]|jgi:cation diffusion facilitator family transporter
MASEKQQIALVSLAASAGLAIAKLVAALVTGSLGILSEAVHSLLDVGATAITFLAVRYADQPADEGHHYGHGKAESIAALIETGLLFGTTAWIVWEAIDRLTSAETHVNVVWWAVFIVAVSIVVDYNRARVLNKAAKKHSSEALEADALHFSSDMWSSLVVLFGLGAVWFGFPQADAVAAIVVAAFVALAGWRLGRRTLNTLLDAAPEGAVERIREIIRDTEGILSLRRCRIRRAGAALFIDLEVNVRRTLPMEKVTEIKERLAARIRKAYRQADISITQHPVALDDETVFDKVMMAARRRSLAIHHLTVQHLSGKTSVSFDLEVDGGMRLSDAHDVASGLEGALRRELGPEAEIDTHIEPIHLSGLEGEEAPPDERNVIEHWLRRFAAEIPNVSDVHNIRVRRNSHGVFVTYHCRVNGDHSVETIHEAVDDLESRLRKKLPQVRRVVAHAEPLTAGPH